VTFHPVVGGGSSGFTNPMTTAGDMIDATTGGTAQRLAIGSSGELLAVSSGAPAWETLASAGVYAVAGGTLTGALVPSVSALTDGASIAVNASLGNVFTVTIAGNRTMAAPTNHTAGQTIQFHITQDGTGSRTISWASGASGYNFGAGSAPTLTTTAGDTDIVGFSYDATQGEWCYLGSQLGF
jgi:hypothetical protein